MTTFYLDYSNGDDSYAGDSFAAGHPWKTITAGATAARIAPGDIIHIAKSPVPFSIGNADWTNLSKTVTLATAGLTKVVDLCESAFTSVTGLITVLNATPTAGGAGYAVNDTFNITTGGTGATGRVTSVSGGVVTGVVLLKGGNGGYTTGAGKATTKISGGGNNALTVNITTIGTGTAGQNSANYNKEGTYALSVTCPSSVDPGSKLAFRAISPGTLAGYQNLSFFITNNNAVTAGQWRICLCSDTIGEVVVDEFLIPAITVAGGRMIALNIAKTGGGNMGASIASIAIYSDTVAPASSSIIYLDNIIATTTGGLNLQSLISKNAAEQGGSEPWLAIQSINDTVVKLDQDPYQRSADGRGYSGATEAAKATYARETIKTSMTAGTTTPIQEVQDSGTDGNNIQFQGGYNTSNDTRDGETFFDAFNGIGVGLQLTGKSYITINYLNFVRFAYGIIIDSTSSYNLIPVCSNLNNNGIHGLYCTGNYNTFTLISNACNNGSSDGIYCYGSFNIFTTVTNCNSNAYGANGDGFVLAGLFNTIVTLSNCNNNSRYGFYLSSHNNTITTVSNCNNNGNYGVAISGSFNYTEVITNANTNATSGVYVAGTNNVIKALSTTGNTNSGMVAGVGENYIWNAVMAEASKVLYVFFFAKTRLFSSKDQGGAYSKIYTDGGFIESQVTTLTNGSGKEWKFTTEVNTNRQLTYPLTLTIAKIAVTANNLVTVKAWFKKGHATNIGAKLVCRVGQIAWSDGTSDIVDTKTNDTDEEELQIQFTPTEDGVVEIEAWAYYIAGHSTVIVDQATITQA